MTTLPTRQQIDRAAALDFPEREKQANITIEAGPLGLTVRCEYTGTLASIPAAIERLRSAGVLDLVRPLPISAPRAKKTKIEPLYNGAGDPCCPKHPSRVLKEGKFGLYCPARDESTERGFCDLKFS